MNARIESIPALDDDALNVIVETPKGQRSKFKYDPEHGIFRLQKSLPLGLVFPFDFGFVPSTLGGDGDPLDALILGNEPSMPGILVLCELTAVMEAEQTERGETKRNDRFIVIPLDAKSREPLQPKMELTEDLLNRIKEFFVVYNELQGEKFKSLGVHGPKRACEILQEGIGRVRRADRQKARHAAH
jgi:inorganic pyrophosphatase